MVSGRGEGGAAAADGPPSGARVMVDEVGRIVHWDDGAAALFGHQASDVLGRPVDVIVPEDSRDAHWAGLHRVVDGGEPHLDGARTNLPVLVASGEVLAFPARFTLVRDPWDRVVGALATFAARRGHEEPWSEVGPAPSAID